VNRINVYYIYIRVYIFFGRTGALLTLGALSGGIPCLPSGPGLCVLILRSLVLISEHHPLFSKIGYAQEENTVTPDSNNGVWSPENSFCSTCIKHRELMQQQLIGSTVYRNELKTDNKPLSSASQILK
jgi:hypothetical protein